MPGSLRIASLATARTLAISVPTVLESFTRSVRMETCNERLARWSRGLLADAGIRIDLVGAEHLAFAPPCIVMSNHQSLYDVPVLFQVVPGTLRMVTKIELFRVPIWGSAMRAAGFIAIDRRNPQRAFRSLAEARQKLEQGVTVWIAPEGTRSRTGALLPFKKGGFVLAEEMGAAILPVSIHGTRDILVARDTEIRVGGRVRVTVHPRIETGSGGGREELMRRVREAIASGLGA